MEELKKLLRETLERNRAFVAGMAFGVPAEAALEYTDAIVDDLARVVKPLIGHLEDDDPEFVISRKADEWDRYQEPEIR